MWMPVISLWQPYASLIFTAQAGDDKPIKRHETRKRPPPLKYVGGFIGIHACAKFPAAKHISDELHELCLDVFGCSYNHTLPLGSLIGSVRISGGLPTDTHHPASDDDRIAGDWTPGRFAWPLSDTIPFSAALPMKGKQGWWRCPIPDHLGRPPTLSHVSGGDQ